MPSTFEWLIHLSWLAVGLGLISAVFVLVHLSAGHAQKMWIMNVVWPVTALWSGLLGLWAYFRYGTAGSRRCAQKTRGEGREPPNKAQPFPVLVAKGTTHCGSGCTLGDILAGAVFVIAPISLFGRRLFGGWIYDFVAAFLLGIAFQYFTIKPMRHVSAPTALKDALKADTLSLLAWQIGMYGWMALVTFVLLRRELHPTSVVFWFMMQLGMLVGFMTAYPVNWWLLKRGIKEAM